LAVEEEAGLEGVFLGVADAGFLAVEEAGFLGAEEEEAGFLLLLGVVEVASASAAGASSSFLSPSFLGSAEDEEEEASFRALIAS
jgi:hypothetical protein